MAGVAVDALDDSALIVHAKADHKARTDVTPYDPVRCRPTSSRRSSRGPGRNEGLRPEGNAGSRLACPAGYVWRRRGYKGQIWLNLIARGGTRGGTLDGRDIWAANVAWVDSPLWRLTRAVNTLVDVDDRISIDGFWDHVRPFGESEKRDVAKLLDAFDEEAVKRSLKIARSRTAIWEGPVRALRDEPAINLGLDVLPGRPTNPEYTKGVVDGRLLNFGRLDLRGTGVDDIHLPALADPLALRKALQDGMAAAAQATVSPAPAAVARPAA